MEVKTNRSTQRLCLNLFSKPHYNLSKSLQKQILDKYTPRRIKKTKLLNKIPAHFMKKYSLSQMPSKTLYKPEINTDIKEMMNHKTVRDMPKKKLANLKAPSLGPQCLKTGREVLLNSNRNSNLKTPEFAALNEEAPKRMRYNSQERITRFGTIIEENLANILSPNYDPCTPDKFMSPKFGTPRNHSRLGSESEKDYSKIHINLHDELDCKEHEISFDCKDTSPAKSSQPYPENYPPNIKMSRKEDQPLEQSSEEEGYESPLKELGSGADQASWINITQIKRIGEPSILHSFCNPNLPFQKFRIRKSNVTNIDYNDPAVEKILNSEKSNTQFPQLDRYKEVVKKCLADPDYLLSTEYLETEINTKPITKFYKSRSSAKIKTKKSYFEKPEWREQIRNLNCIRSLRSINKTTRTIPSKHKPLSIENYEHRSKKITEKEIVNPPALRPMYRKSTRRLLPLTTKTKTLKLDPKALSGALILNSRLK
ncbi:unnamed protein product [Moneuplotes crassus]|uniref:Uncharacterized protein n=1 Tax=Euplotes crassus TaxID=5936 RepID=A0AAD1UAS5_EUPCR|nr:unnamed protein product [Moneuplotes crassus]